MNNFESVKFPTHSKAFPSNRDDNQPQSASLPIKATQKKT